MSETRPSGTQSVAFHAGHGVGADWMSATHTALEQIGAGITGANLGFVYVTDPFAESLGDMVGFLREKIGVPHWVGTVGMGICALGREYFDEPAVAIMVTSLPEDSFRMVPPLFDSVEEIGDPFAAWVAAVQPSFGVVHADPRNAAVVELIADLSERTSSFLVGGLSSSRGGMRQVADSVVEGALSGVLFSSEFSVITGLTQGCSPIGPVRTVTRSARNMIAEIEGRPALDVLREDMGEMLSRDLRRAITYIHAALPVPGSDRADYMVRNISGFDVERGVVAIGALVDPGDRVMFTRRDPASAEKDLRRMLREMEGRLKGPIAGGIYVSCLARGPNMFGPNSRELGIVAEELGEFPLVGFFANGELSHNRLYGYTGVLSLFQ